MGKTNENNELHEEINELQNYQINIGLESGVDISKYNTDEYNFLQMEQIRLGLEHGVDVSLYDKPYYDQIVMREIRLSLEEGISITEFLGDKVDGLILQEIRKAKKNKVDISKYVKRGYDSEQLYHIRKSLEADVDIDKYLKIDFNGAQIKEIAIGIDNRVDVSIYATDEFNWMQMREIRTGLEEALDVSAYARKLASYKQMREIRIGLQQGLDVSLYSSLIYSAADMSARRIELYNEKCLEEDNNQLKSARIEELENQIKEADYAEENANIESVQTANQSEKELGTVTVSEDGMTALLLLNRPAKDVKITKKKITNLLFRSNVKYGIIHEEIDKMIKDEIYNKEIVVAKGKECVDGKDAEYKFTFPENLSTAPKVNEDGSVDYHEMNVFFMIEKDELLAEYIPPKAGVFGFRIDGSVIAPVKGNDLPALHGRGFYMSKDRRKYYASFAGKISRMSDYEIEILKVLVLENVDVSTGNVYFEGDIIVKKDIRSGYLVKATGNIIVNGHIEESEIESGGEVIVKQGMHGNYKGKITANGNVCGTFFEASEIFTNNNFTANYILNCQVKAYGKVKLSGRKGTVLGGTVYGALGVEAYKIGNDSEIKTEIQTGVQKSLLDELMLFSKKYDKIKSEIKLLEDSKEKLERQNDLSIEKMILLEKINLAHDMKTKEIEEQKEEEERVKGILTRASLAKITGIGTVYRGTVIMVQSKEITVNNTINHVYFSNDRVKGVVAKRL